MKYLILFFSFLLCFNGDESITWNGDRKLSWSDFKGPINFEKDAIAETVSGISFSYSVKTRNLEIVDFEANVVANFYPERSWYKIEKCDDYILSHEQLHFDITELHVRILRQKIGRLEVSPMIKTQLNDLRLQINEDLYLMQELYDLESDHSKNKDLQHKWQLYIESELERYSDYASEND